jgi:hypothetical protein
VLFDALKVRNMPINVKMPRMGQPTPVAAREVLLQASLNPDLLALPLSDRALLLHASIFARHALPFSHAASMPWSWLRFTTVHTLGREGSSCALPIMLSAKQTSIESSHVLCLLCNTQYVQRLIVHHHHHHVTH